MKSPESSTLRKLWMGTCAAASLFIAGEAKAQYVEMEAAGDPKTLCTWEGAESSAPLRVAMRATQDGANKVLEVETTPGAKVLLKGGYPPDDGWEPIGSTGTATRHSGRVINTSHVPVVLEDGTFAVSVMAPLRDKSERKLRLACVQKGPGADGINGTPDDVETARIPLEAHLKSNGRVQNAAFGSGLPGFFGEEVEGEFPYREREKKVEVKKEPSLDLTVSAGAALQNTVHLAPQYDLAGYRVTAEADPRGLQFSDGVRVPLTLQLSGGQNRERFELSDGTRPVAEVDVHCATVGPSVELFMQETGRHVSAVLGLGVGACSVGRLTVPVKTPAVAGPVGNFHAALRAGSERFGVQVGADIQAAGDEAFQLWGVQAGAYVRFPGL